ncbi:MAG TPA: hypothetical protein VII43_10350 [Opitutaceae bacterium]
MRTSPSNEAPWRSGLRGARANFVPGAALVLASLVLVIGYYREPGVHRALTRLLEIRQSSGLGFGIVSTALFGAVLPLLYIRFGRRAGRGAPGYGAGRGLCLTAFWAYKGIEVDVWYRLQAHWIGSGHDATTIAVKVFLDQFVYCPAFAVPVTTAVYQLVQAWPDRRGFLADVSAPGWYRRRVLPVLIANAGVWIPAVAVIYALPTPLQLPLQNIVLCFYTLVLVHQMRADGGEPAGGAGPKQ